MHSLNQENMLKSTNTNDQTEFKLSISTNQRFKRNISISFQKIILNKSLKNARKGQVLVTYSQRINKS
ncbi:hypothetical protein FGO68_gene9584 [Halteria grandinella]|uniref:Uncharacterized protein n=1 Tax=Halteria grandinella TaxID=5974 RepID=A0A8J8NI74_HALGN|nr:hypothetical protein FGO68_gene9584 [Halteria grandinella]